MKLRIVTYTLLFVTSSFIAKAQKDLPNIPIDSLTQKITYTKVINVDSNISKLQLFSQARQWLKKTINSSTNAIQIDDKESGEIVGKSSMQVYCKSLGSTRECGFVNFTISIFVKNGRYKYEVTNFYHTGQPANSIPDYGACENWINDQRKYPMMSQKAVQKISNYFLTQLDTNTLGLIADLKKFMKAHTNDNW